MHKRVYKRMRERVHKRVREKGQARSLSKKWIEGRDTRQRQIEMRRHARMNARTRAQARAETRAREGTSPKFTKNGLKEKTRSRSRDGAHKTEKKWAKLRTRKRRTEGEGV